MQREISLKQKCVALEKLCRTMNAERETIGKEAENARRVENEHFSTSRHICQNSSKTIRHK